jgi:hypothetical protein
MGPGSLRNRRQAILRGRAALLLERRQERQETRTSRTRASDLPQHDDASASSGRSYVTARMDPHPPDSAAAIAPAAAAGGVPAANTEVALVAETEMPVEEGAVDPAAPKPKKGPTARFKRRTEVAEALISARYNRPAQIALGVPELAQARARMQAHFDAMVIDPTMDQEEQRRLMQRYIDVNAPVEAAQTVLYGGLFEPGKDMRTQFLEGTLNSSFEGTRGGASSAHRSPARNGAVTRLTPRPDQPLTFESIHVVDANALGGVAGGVLSYYFEQDVDPALLSVAKQANLPTMMAVPAELIVPAPSRERFTTWQASGVTVVRFHLAGLEDEPALHEEGLPGKQPTWPELQKKAEAWRDSIRYWQGMFEEKGWALLLQPFLTACLNSLRPLMLSDSQLQQAITVFCTSAAMSSLAGGLTKALLSLAKAAPRVGQAHVFDVLGRPQWLNMYVVMGRAEDEDADDNMAAWSDIIGLPLSVLKTAAKVAVNVGETGGDFLDAPLETMIDLVMRHVAPNTFVSVAPPATANVMLEPFTGSAIPPPGEDPRSFVGRSRVSIAGGLNDYLWPTMRDRMALLKARAEKRRAERRAVRAANRTRLTAQRDKKRQEILLVRARLVDLMPAMPDALLAPEDRARLQAALDRMEFEPEVLAWLMRLAEEPHEAEQQYQLRADLLSLVQKAGELAALDAMLQGTWGLIRRTARRALRLQPTALNFGF